MKRLKSLIFIILLIIVFELGSTIVSLLLAAQWEFIKLRFSSWGNFFTPGLKPLISYFIATALTPILLYGVYKLIDKLKPNKRSLKISIIVFIIFEILNIFSNITNDHYSSLTVIMIISFLLSLIMPSYYLKENVEKIEA